MPADHLLDYPGVRQKHLSLNSVTVANPVNEPIGLFGLAAGVDGEDANARVNAPRHINQSATFGLEARTDSQLAAEFFERPAQYFLRFLIVQFDRSLACFEFIHQVTFGFHNFTIPACAGGSCRQSAIGCAPEAAASPAP